MSDDLDSVDLNGKLLIAMPGMGDPRFERSVVYMCAHSTEGAMGLIVNKPAPGLQLSDLLEQLEIPKSIDTSGGQVYFGGPVEHGRGFVLHSTEYAGAGPAQRILALGYSGWGPGQLEDEIHRNGWLTCDASPEIVFQDNDNGKWVAALGVLGIDPLLLSAEAGRA